MEQRYALLEQGCVHTEDLTLDEVNEAVVIRNLFDNETQITDQRYKNMKL